ncbi:MAG TPA: PQQ-binding-like beta-propeller repeat protein [Vicinamibacterales bacterium]|nr:PQQ-binding-like beta-propeller repeat protein [Vicinamibacterales bacterium]
MARAVRWTRFTLVAAVALMAAHTAVGQGGSAGEWPAYGRDLANTRYSPLDQIGPGTLTDLHVAWRWHSEAGQPIETRNESTPIMVGGTLYFTSSSLRSVIAADAETGKTLWQWQVLEGDRAAHAPRRDSGRGVAYWSSGTESRIFTVTPGFTLVALDAKTGTPVASFGKDGIVDLKAQLGVPIDLVNAAIGNSSPPLVFADTVVIGPALEVGLAPPSMKNVPGRILAIDARTGALKWRFNTIPVKGEPGYETWENGSAEYTGNAGAWAPLTLDERRGYLYLPIEAPTGDYFGGHRLGNNLFSTTLACLDIRTGKMIWHYQIVHHDIWDRDNPTAPILANVTIDGRPREIVVQLTKQAFAYVFDRVTGQPIWPIVERPVPASDVPSERAAATQPIPSKPAGYDRQGVTRDDLIDFTPALREQAIQALQGIRLGQLFSPPSLAQAPDGTRGTLVAPGNLGGSNWEPAAFDPETGMLYVGSWTNPTVYALTSNPQRSDMNYIAGGGQVPRVSGLPILKPPYSRITAINLRTGEHAWMVPNGDTPPAIASNPALAGLTIPPTGAQSRPILLATKTVLFNADGSAGQPKLRALDKATGKRLWEMTMPGVVGSPPMTYMTGGKQFLVMWVADRASGKGAELVALTIK